MKINQIVPFTIPHSGVEILVRHVSPMLAVEVRRTVKPPKPPMEEVTYGDGKKVMEANEAHPDYLKAMEDYQAELERRYRTLLIKRGIVGELTEAQAAEVKSLREFWKEEYGVELDPGVSDRIVYFSYIALSDQDDINAVSEKILAHSQPTPEAVAAAEDSF